MVIITEAFLLTLQNLIIQHHTIYPYLPPQGVFFEYLVQHAFHLSGRPDVQIIATTPNAPSFDLQVANRRFSIKTETGKGTDLNLISITKLCTTEKEPWAPQVLIDHVIQHMSNYDNMLMLRAIWLPKPTKPTAIHYQLVQIPLDLLRLISTVEIAPVGRRSGRQSLAGDVLNQGQVVFHVHFDGADGKCQVRNLRVTLCQILREWDQRI
jgi:hypothetical protein